MMAQAENRPLKICLYSTRALPKRGGQEIVVDALARQFTSQGHQVVVLAPRSRQADLVDSNLPYQMVRHARFISTRWLVSFYRRYLIKLHQTHRFDVIHCHGLHPAGYLGSLCRTALPCPLVLTNHSGNLDAEAAGTHRAIIHERYRQAVVSADLLIANSQHSADLLRRLAQPGQHIVVIPNGVAVEEFTTAQQHPVDLPSDIRPGRYVVFLGRLRESKGADLLLKAFARLEGVDHMTVVLGGTGTEERPLKKLALQLDIDHRVKFVGWVTGRTKAYLLQNSFCAVIPSREAEGFGLVAVESFAAGRPVIASRVQGLTELVRDDETGLLFDTNSIDSLASALRTLIGNRARADRLGAAGRLMAQSYRWTTVVDRHLQLYRSLCTGRSRNDLNSLEPQADGDNQAKDEYDSLARS